MYLAERTRDPSEVTGVRGRLVVSTACEAALSDDLANASAASEARSPCFLRAYG
jgi:hypothetical protein